MEAAPSLEDFLAELPTDPSARVNAIAPAVREYQSAVRAHLEALHRSSGSGRLVNERNSDLTDRMVPEALQPGGGDLRRAR